MAWLFERCADAGRQKRTYVVYCDAEIAKQGGVQEYTPGQEIDFRPVGAVGPTLGRRSPEPSARAGSWPRPST